jgi:hypothetical protein
MVQAPTRIELAVPLKALVSQINYNLFDLEVTAQQSQFAYLQAKDLADAWTGSCGLTMWRCGTAPTHR